MDKARLLEEVCFIGGIVSFFLPYFFYGLGHRESANLSLNLAAAFWISAYALAMRERYIQAKARVRELIERRLNLDAVTPIPVEMARMLKVKKPPIHMDDYSDYRLRPAHETTKGIEHMGPRFECPECAKPGFSSG